MERLLIGSPVYVFVTMLIFEALRNRALRRELMTVLSAVALIFFVYVFVKGGRVEDIPVLMKTEIGKISKMFSNSSFAVTPMSYYFMVSRKCHRIVRLVAKAVFAAGVCGIIYLLYRTGYIPAISF